MEENMNIQYTVYILHIFIFNVYYIYCIKCIIYICIYTTDVNFVN